jgi:hypothetical protein
VKEPHYYLYWLQEEEEGEKEPLISLTDSTNGATTTARMTLSVYHPKLSSCEGATILSIMVYSRHSTQIRHSITTLSTTVSSAVLLSVFMLNAILVCIFHAECHYFERRCAEGRGAAGNALYVS